MTRRPSLVTNLRRRDKQRSQPLPVRKAHKATNGAHLSVRLHVSLLEVVGKLVHVLVVREEGVGLSAVKVVVPDPEEGEEDGQVVLELGLEEVLVHLVRAGQELVKVVRTDEEHDREADGGPERVTAADPFPEGEHDVGVDAERLDRLLVGRESTEVLRDVLLLWVIARISSVSERE